MQKLLTPSLLTALLLLGAAPPVDAATYYVRKDGNNACTGLVDAPGSSGACAWATVAKANATLVAGDTVILDDGSYDELLSPVNAGTPESPITYKGRHNCATNNGTTINLPCAAVRRVLVPSTKPHVVVQGIEVTSQGMSAETIRQVWLGGNYTKFINNYVHHTEVPYQCITISTGAFITISGNNVQWCRPSMWIVATKTGPYNIQAGVNDKISISVNGGAAQTFTLTPGTARSVAQIDTELTPQLVGASVCGPGTCEQRLNIGPTTGGPRTTMELLDVPNNAYTTLGMRVGLGDWLPGTMAVGNGGGATHWLIENNHFSYLSDFLYPGDTGPGVYRDNISGPSNTYHHTHIDLVQPGGADQILIEGDLAIDSNNFQNHILLAEGANLHYIFRYTRTCRHRGALNMRNGGNFFYFYNNTYWNNFAVYNGIDGSQIYLQEGVTNALARNNIWYRSRQNPIGVYQFQGNATIDKDYDAWWEVADPKEAHAINADPLVMDGVNCDFRLSAASPVIDRGGPLTTVATSDFGSGPSLVLVDARPFQDGWAGVIPDAIAVGSVNNVGQIVSIDYATGTVILASGITRKPGDPVWLYADSRGRRVLYGTAPDIGAFESNYGAGVAPAKPGLLRIQP